MARAVDIVVAAALLILLLPVILMMQGLLALNREPMMRAMQRYNQDKLPLLFQVLQNKLTIREWWRLATYTAWWR